MGTGTVFYQLFEQESSTFTYLIADGDTKEAALIDPVRETVERDLKLIQELGLHLKYVLDTHVHADHITGAGEVRERTKAHSGVSATANVPCVDIPLNDGQELMLGNKKIKVIATPGHTNSCMSFLFEGRVFTGDALLIRGTGRTDFQQGSAEKLFHSVHDKLFALPGDTKVYPGHDYRGQTSSTIEMEKKFNPRLGGANTVSDFIRTMSELKLAHPKKIHEAVPANMNCGFVKDFRFLHPTLNDGLPEVTVEQVKQGLGKITILDVREPAEFNNELGHIEGARLVTLGSQLTDYLKDADRNEEIIFVCRSGGRSGQATLESKKYGFTKTVNMVGGMLKWNESGFAVHKS